MKTSSVARIAFAVGGLLGLLLAPFLSAQGGVSHGEDPGWESSFWNWPSVTLYPQVGDPNPRDVAIRVEATFPNQQEVGDWGRAVLVEGRLIRISLELPGANVLLPAVDRLTHTYVLNQDPHTVVPAVVLPDVTRQHLDLGDGSYTVVFQINGRVLAKTEFSLPLGEEPPPPDPDDPPVVKARFQGTYLYGSGLPFVGITGTLRFTQPIGYHLDEETLGDDDLSLTNANGETLGVHFESVAVLESYLEQIVATYRIDAPVFAGAPETLVFQAAVNPGAITFNDGALAVQAGPVGELRLSWPAAELSVRVSLMEPPPPRREASTQPIAFTVGFSSPNAFDPPIDAGTVGNDDFQLVLPNANRRLPARFVSFFPTFAPGTAIAHYEVDPPRPEGWTEADNGSYLINLQAGAVRTYRPNSAAQTNAAVMGGLPLPAQTLGVLVVAIAPPTPPLPSAEAPIVVAEARPLTASPMEPVRDIIPYTFRILVIDQSGVDPDTIAAATITARRYPRPVPGESAADSNVPASLPAPEETLTAVITGVASLDPGQTVVQADAELIAPDGIWDTNENGHYVLGLQGGQIADTAGHAHPGGYIGSFGVMIHPLHENVVEVGQGWNYSSFLGYFSEETFPWYGHPDHGWRYAARGGDRAFPGNPGQDDWIYDLGLDRWLYTSLQAYPFFFSAADGEWLYYFPDTRQPRFFHGMTSGRTFTD